MVTCRRFCCVQLIRPRLTCLRWGARVVVNHKFIACAFATPNLSQSTFYGRKRFSSTVMASEKPNRFSKAEYSSDEKKELDQWTSNAATFDSSPEKLADLNNHLSSRTTILGSKPSAVDVTLYEKLAPVVDKWSLEERTGQTGYHHIVRYVDFVQNSEVFQLDIPNKINIDQDKVIYKIPPVDAKAEKERKKKQKELLAAAVVGGGAAGTVAASTSAAVEKVKEVGGKIGEKAQEAKDAVTGNTEKKEKKKKEKKPQPPKEVPKEKVLSPSLIDLRVGHILKAIQHPNADSLYVSTIAVGDPPGTENTSVHEGQIVRTVCSGLNGLIPLEDMQNRKIVAVANLKPVTMRGIKSCAMVLAASPREEGDGHKGPVELVNPPADSKAGERVYFEGWEGDPELVLNPKKKVWETIQPGFTTTDSLEVGFDVDVVPQLKESGKTGIGKLRTKEGLCSVNSLKGATVR